MKILFEAIKLFFQVVGQISHPPIRWNETLQAIVQIGVESIPIIAIATAFAGLVVTNEIAWHMEFALGTTSMVPGFTGQFIMRELGITIPALLLVAKVGAAITAEIGTMKITEQLDALKLLGINPVHYLVVPRFVASIVSTISLTLIAVSVTLTCATWVAVQDYGFSLSEYLNTLRHFVGPKDLLCAVVKGAVFGAVTPIIACQHGFNCEGGAEGVGTATTNAVVSATIAVIVLDFLLTYLFTMIF
jgi:phospholipid/cholesterol/gamma-HCH transport system permease protein